MVRKYIVLLLIISGSTGCAFRHENLAAGRASAASSTWGYYNGPPEENYKPGKALDGDLKTSWFPSAQMHYPHFIDIYFDAPVSVYSLDFVISQRKEGLTVHRVYALSGEYTSTDINELWNSGKNETQEIHLFSGITGDYDHLKYVFPRPIPNIYAIRVYSEEGPCHIGWYELNVLGEKNEHLD
jgi:hypothetical protein